jgi:O-antigen ligase
LDWLVLLQVVICAGPAMLAVHLEQPTLGAKWLFLSVALSLAVNLLFRAPPADLTLIIGIMPALMLLRDLFLYNSIAVLLAIPLANLVLRSRQNLRRLHRAGITLFFSFGLLYWLVSYAMTGEYFRNLRIVEMTFSAAAVVLLAARREMLATAIFGALCTLAAIGLAFLGLSDRLSYAVVDGFTLGNPISYGVPLALVLTLCAADGGKWLLLQRLPFVRLAIALVTSTLLLLSTSRASWLVAGASVLLILVFNGSHRKFVLTALTVLVLTTPVLLQTEQGASLAAWGNRTFSSSRTILQRTSGRSDQWLLFPMVLADAPVWGFGPGMGAKIYARYSLLSDQIRFKRGNAMAWHSLYLQIGVETGVIGLAVLIALLGRILVRTYQHWARTTEIVPLLGVAGFLIVAATVSGMDPGAGMFLGFGFLAGHRGPFALRTRSPENMPPAGPAHAGVVPLEQ